MARGGPGSVAKLKLPAGWPRTEPYIVWSWFEGQWWRVDGGADPSAMQASAAARMAVVAGTHNRRGAPLNRAARFIATARDGDPEQEWRASRSDHVTCQVCLWEGLEWEAPGYTCPRCGQGEVNVFMPG